MRPTRRAAIVGLMLLALAWPGPALALDTQIREIRTIGDTVRASIELRDLFSDKLKEILQSGSAIHIRIQAEIWEDRPLWDKLVRPALFSVFRIVRDPTTSQIALSDAVGTIMSFAQVPDPLSLRVEVAPAQAVKSDSRYYLRIVATIGTMADRDIQDAGAAVFGRDDGSVGIGTVGRAIFNAVLQTADYLQSVSTETRSTPFRGRDISR
jgi:hypothetical protein